jgi:hypothetical protein
VPLRGMASASPQTRIDHESLIELEFGLRHAISCLPPDRDGRLIRRWQRRRLWIGLSGESGRSHDGPRV